MSTRPDRHTDQGSQDGERRDQHERGTEAEGAPDNQEQDGGDFIPVTDRRLANNAFANVREIQAEIEALEQDFSDRVGELQIRLDRRVKSLKTQAVLFRRGLEAYLVVNDLVKDRLAEGTIRLTKQLPSTKWLDKDAFISQYRKDHPEWFTEVPPTELTYKVSANAVKAHVMKFGEDLDHVEIVEPPRKFEMSLD